MAETTLPKYKYLLTYRYAEIISDLTVEFCQQFLGDISYLGDLKKIPTRRTIEQMTQAARSGKQNIIEGVGQSPTSKKGEIKLLGVALASYEELIADFEDYLRQRGVEIYKKDDARALEFRKMAIEATKEQTDRLLRLPKLPREPEMAGNFLLTLCHIQTYLLSRQINSLIDKFEKEGGFNENLYKRRISYLGNLSNLKKSNGGR